MKTSAIVCAVLAGSFGFSSIASARDHREDGRGERGQRSEQRQDRQERREFRQERREERAVRQDRQEDRAYRQGYRAGVQQPQFQYQQPRQVYQQPRYVYQQQPSYGSYGYGQPAYRAHAPRFYRGGYLPQQYRSHAYYVNDWHSHSHLYAPPYGHQWVNVDGEFLLIALATGLIANALLN